MTPVQVSTLEVVLNCLIPKLTVDTVEDVNQFLWQRSLINDVHVCSQLGSAGCANDYCVALFTVQDAVVCGPSESSRVAIDAMLGCHFRGLVRSNCDLWL